MKGTKKDLQRIVDGIRTQARTNPLSEPESILLGLVIAELETLGFTSHSREDRLLRLALSRGVTVSDGDSRKSRNRVDKVDRSTA